MTTRSSYSRKWPFRLFSVGPGAMPSVFGAFCALASASCSPSGTRSTAGSGGDATAEVSAPGPADGGQGDADIADGQSCTAYNGSCSVSGGPCCPGLTCINQTTCCVSPGLIGSGNCSLDTDCCSGHCEDAGGLFGICCNVSGQSCRFGGSCCSGLQCVNGACP
jgi:hypothetical protein